MMLDIAVHSKSIVSDARVKLSWKQIRELVDETPSGVHFLAGGNTISQAVTLLAAATGKCCAVPLNPRLTLHDREALHNQFAQVKPVPGVYIATSGSQGKPKLVHLSPAELVGHARAVNEHLQIREQDLWLACLPFFHVGGMAIVMRCALTGAGLDIAENAEAEQLTKGLDRQITIVSLVPTVLRRILEIRNDALPKSLRAIILGGSPIPKDLIERCPQVLPTYGLTEAGSMVTCAKPNCESNERFSAGSLIPGAAIKIVDDNQIELPHDQVGRIVVQSPGAPSEYWRNEKETAQTFRLGWIVTEDAGYLDAHGCLHVLGRRDRMIVSGGENISLEEVETSIRTLPNVRDTLCIGLEDLNWGQCVAAVIESDDELTLEGVRDSLRENLTAYKLPKKIAVVSRLPLLANGKPDLQAAKILFG